MASHDDIPPPPYSETDILSASSDQRSRAAGSQRANSHDDLASVPASAASSTGEVIYTPPLTPRSSNQSNFPHDDDHLTTSSAAAYFESRPARSFHSGQQRVHSITVRPNSSPDDFPLPSEWADRDVRPEDWQTFVNYLIPHYSADSNSQVIERKLRAEGIQSDTRSQKSGASHAEAQLNQIRSPDTENPRRQNLEDTVREWNDGFFAPRGVTIRLNPVPDEPHVPGAWDQSFDPPNADANGSRGFGRGFFGRSENAPSSGGFRFGGITVDGDRVAIGNNFVADRNGVRIGGIVADTNGISRGGVPLFPGASQHNAGFPGNARCGPGGGGPFGMGFGAQGCGPGASHHGYDLRGGWGHRGRSWHRGGHHHEGRRHHGRSRSRSSSSSSSSSSDSSVGSLPDYDDLRDGQLPMAKHLLERWLNHPEQPITKDSVKRVRDELKAAKKNPTSEPLADKAALRREVKALTQQWKALKKQQKNHRRQLKRERRDAKRAAKRERRNVRHGFKDARRRLRRGEIPHSNNFPFGLGSFMTPPAPHGPYGGGPAPHAPYGVPGVSAPHGAPAGVPGPHGGPFGLGGLLNRFAGPGRGGFGGGGGSGGGPWRGPFGGGYPGAWPAGADEAGHEGSQAKFRAAEDLEQKIAAKEVELQKIHEELVKEEEEKEKDRGGEKGKGEGDGKTQSKAQLAAQKLEEEMDALQKDMEKIRLEADEEYARELAEEDARAH